MSRLEKIRQNKQEQPLVYSRTEKPEQKSFKGAFVLSILVILFGCLVYLLFFSRIFAIKYIEVNGYSDPAKVQELASEQIGGETLRNNILLFNNGALSETLSGDPLISAVNTRRVFPNKIVINITESKPSIIWYTGGEGFVIDERGVVIGPSDNSVKNLPIVYDSSGIKVTRGDQVASPTFINFIQVVWSNFQNAAGSKISKITIFDLLTDVHVLSSTGWTVYLDASKNPNVELENLTKVLKSAGAATSKLEYIDLRMDNKAFYK